MTCHLGKLGQVLPTEWVNHKANSTSSRDQYQGLAKAWGQQTVCRPHMPVKAPPKTCNKTEEPSKVDLSLPHSTILVPWRESTNSRLRVCYQLPRQTRGLAMLQTRTAVEWQVYFSVDLIMKLWAVKLPSMEYKETCLTIEPTVHTIFLGSQVEFHRQCKACYHMDRSQPLTSRAWWVTHWVVPAFSCKMVNNPVLEAKVEGSWIILTITNQWIKLINNRHWICNKWTAIFTEEVWIATLLIKCQTLPHQHRITIIKTNKDPKVTNMT